MMTEDFLTLRNCPASNELPFLVRLGTVTDTNRPALFPMVWDKPLFLCHESKKTKELAVTLQYYLFQLLLQSPVGKLQIILLDDKLNDTFYLLQQAEYRTNNFVKIIHDKQQEQLTQLLSLAEKRQDLLAQSACANWQNYQKLHPKAGPIIILCVTESYNDVLKLKQTSGRMGILLWQLSEPHAGFTHDNDYWQIHCNDKSITQIDDADNQWQEQITQLLSLGIELENIPDSDWKHANSVLAKRYGATTLSLHLNIDTHAKHLQRLLSQTHLNTLVELVDNINGLSKNLNYLQKNHPYLATSIEELIKDLIDNTIVRLDTQVKAIVGDGDISPDAKNRFQQEHADNINQVLSNHLKQVNELNQTILDKQMANFKTIGNPSEIKFRDTLMEFKILLKWLITQTSDDIQKISHTVLLDKLEKDTLAQMRQAFLRNNTTEAQREKLQKQLEMLLNHFQNKSSTQGGAIDTELLNLSSDDVSVSLETDTFIEFNEYYIKQLQQHW